jgi:type IV pilus assembly protein PilY1
MAMMRCIQLFALALASTVGTIPAAQAAITISDVPLFLSVNVAPNVIMTFDDSGSMERGYVPDSIGESNNKLNSARFTAASYNGLYYNPLVTYPIPTRSDGVTYSTSFTKAWINGFDTSKGSRDLSDAGYRPITRCDPTQTYSNCDKATGSGTITESTTTTYTYTNCKAYFENRTGNNRKDRITVTGCSMPATGSGAPANADNGKITVSGAGNAYNRSYTVNTSQSSGGGTRIDLSTTNEITSSSANPVNNVTFTWTVTTTTTTTASAYYHLYYTDKPGASKPSGCNDSVENNSCYILIQVGSSNDITPGDTAAQKQNFANWFSFYRTRALATMSAAMNAVTSLGTNQVRLGWQTLNECTSFGTSCKGTDGTSRENRIRSLDALKHNSSSVTHRTDFYNWLQRMEIDGGTPLRSAMVRAGKYLETNGINSPYAEEPYTTLGTELSCRKNFHIMFTDGYWNGDGGNISVGDTDSNSNSLPDGKTYSPQFPYRNATTSAPSGYSHSNSLADIAFHYWANDLRPTGTKNLENNVAPFIIDRSGTADSQYWNPKNDPATWQHMVNFTISLGLGNSMTDPAWGGSTYAGDYPALAAGTKTWPAIDPSPSTSEAPEEHVYDLWHAAINSRGQFFSADNPQAINNAFQSVFDSILSATPSAAALAANSTSIQSGTLVYQARFDSSDWHGQLIAYSVQANGNIGNEQWDASKLIPAPASRKIYTWNGSTGKAFTDCNSSLSAAQKTALNKDGYGATDNKCADRLEWLRGSTSKEQRSGGTFRNRAVSVLGDIINSDPAYVKDEDHGYAAGTSAIPEKNTYAQFVANKSLRTPMVYVGANDGMLHAIRADIGHTNSGREQFAFIPAGVYDKLSQLTETAYSHTFYVDGPPSAGDAYINGSWRTVLVGGLGGGGKSVYALDVTNPDTFSASNVMWEYADATDLGYTYSQPQIARLNNGQWAAIFGNGYNSTSDRAFLYIVNLETGALIKKIAAGTATGNGLSTPTLHDSNGDKIIDTVYAGDLLGNLWKFDLSAATTGSWVLGNNGNPLFSATNQSGQVQPITSQPAIMPLTTGIPSGGVMVYFGTGRYLTSTDPNNTEVQSFYAIWDNGTGTVTRSQLQVQSIVAETNEFGFDIRETSSNTVDWTAKRGWYMDLVVPPTTASGPGKERVISRPLVRYDRVIFVTVIPSTDPCVPGGVSWIMELDRLSGGRTTSSAFDFNNDGGYDDNDRLASGNTGSGVKSTVGITKTPTWLENEETAIKELSGTSGNIMSLKNRKPVTMGTVRRIFWQQIQ